MKIVIRIDEECHGFIGVAEDYQSAVKFLIDDGWLTEYTEIYDDDLDSWHSVKEVFGDDWQNLMMNEWDMDTFSEKMDGRFYLYEETLYSK